jgi:phosphoadenosine phosphosulfate reductase
MTIPTPGLVVQFEERYAGWSTQAMLGALLREILPGKISVVSSFGTESAVLLHMVAQADPHAEIIFVDTLKLFGETLRYRDQLIKLLGLTNVRIIEPDPLQLAIRDPKGLLWQRSTDACCELRKVEPLQRGLKGVSAWISGRKSFQAESRKSLKLFEWSEGRLKINPLAGWSKEDLNDYFERHDLPRHPLEADGYLSIGCMPCTSPVQPGEDARAGRWRGIDKTECGIHMPAGQRSDYETMI